MQLAYIEKQKGANFTFVSITCLIGLFCFREHWPEMFDVVVCMAGKPGFFSNSCFFWSYQLLIIIFNT